MKTISCPDACAMELITCVLEFLCVCVCASGASCRSWCREKLYMQPYYWKTSSPRLLCLYSLVPTSFKSALKYNYVPLLNIEANVFLSNHSSRLLLSTLYCHPCGTCMESYGGLCSKQGLCGIEELILVSPCFRLVRIAAPIYRHNMHRDLGNNMRFQSVLSRRLSYAKYICSV